MNIDDQFNLEHLLFKERRCRTCGKKKELLIDYYLIRKDRGKYPSSYSYECKSCTIKRIIESRNLKKNRDVYPDW
jgi:DNA-directed RNA polymerase subunit M/transcription elongation factor TFIIS|tara:strand:+ start:1219 stop:1443 length:225 start_codon:yes stop_codon:yes gene_type:complete